MENEAVAATADESAGIVTMDGTAGATETTDESILGIGLEPGTEASEQAETTPGEAQAVEPEIGNAPPDWYKPLLKNEDPEVAKAAQSIWNRMQAYSQVGSVSQARAFKEAVDNAGGVDALKDLMQKSQEIDSVDSAYYSADPQQQVQLAEQLASDDPEAFVSMTRISNDTWKQLDPEGFAENTRAAIRGTFSEVSGTNQQTGTSNWEAHLEALAQALKSGNQEGVNDLASRLVAWWGQNASKLGFGEQGQKRVSIDPNQAALERRQNAFNQEQESFYQNKLNDFISSTLNVVSAHVTQRIETAVNKALDGVKVSDGMKKRLIAEIHGEVEKVVKGDSNHRSRINSLINPTPRGKLSDYRMDDGTKRQIVNLAVARASQALPGIAQKVISEWTTDLIGANKSAAAKAKAAAARPDITGNVPASYGGRKRLDDAIAERRKSGRPMTDEEILNY